jgi:hypothetical protein
VSNVQFVDCFDTASGALGDPDPGSGCTFAVWFHDAPFQTALKNIAIINLGAPSGSPDTDGIIRHHNGIGMIDCSGVLGSIVIRGCLWAIYMKGVYASVETGEVFVSNQCGYGSNQSRISADCLSMPHIRSLRLSGAFLFLPSATWNTAPDYLWEIDSMTVDTTTYRQVMIAYAPSALNDINASPTGGNVAILTGTGAGAGERRIVAPSAGDTGEAVLVVQGGPYFPATGALLVAFGGGKAVVDGACNPGDRLKCAGASGLLTVDNSAVPPVAKYRARNKTSAAGVVDVDRI